VEAKFRVASFFPDMV